MSYETPWRSLGETADDSRKPINPKEIASPARWVIPLVYTTGNPLVR
jgi:hypothetical protein